MNVFLTVARSRACIAAVALAALTGFAQAGECPADKVKEGAVTTGEMMPKDVTDTVLSSIDLSSKGGDFAGQMLRFRKLVIQPGGIVPWHDHASRPANIHVVSGSVVEYRSNCEVPIVHNAGDTVPEFGADHAHWWKNTGNEPVVLFSADLLGPSMDDHSM